MARQHDVLDHVRRILYVDHLATMLRVFPAAGSQVLARCIELLDVKVLHRRTEIGEAPGDARIVTGDDVGKSGQGNTGYVERTALQMCFIPEVWNLILQVHVVREQRLSGYGMRARYHPVVGADRGLLRQLRRRRTEGKSGDRVVPFQIERFAIIFILLIAAIFGRRWGRGLRRWRMIVPRCIHVKIGG